METYNDHKFVADAAPRRTEGLLECTRRTEACGGIQCPHKEKHPWEKDCNQKTCSRGEVEKIVYCVEAKDKRRSA